MKSLSHFYEDISKILLEARQKAYVSINSEMVMAYWRIGKRIVDEEQRGSSKADYGAYLIRELARRLTKEYGKGFTEPNVRNFRQFYQIFPENEIRYAVRSGLTWTHYRSIMRIDNPDYIDLVFYNFILKCFVLIDLKLGELTHQDIGQMDMYVRMFEDLHTTEGDSPTIGIILCAEKDQTLVKYSVLDENKQVFASKYKLILPTPEELKAELEREIHNLTSPQPPSRPASSPAPA